MKIEDLFFAVNRCPVIVNKEKVNRYYAIAKEKDQKFLGIKRDKHKYITNEKAFNNAKQLYYKITGIEGSEYKWWMDEEKENFSAILVKGIRMDEFVFKCWQEVFHYIEKEFSKIKFNKQLSNTLFPSGGFDGGAENDFRKFVENKLVNLDLIIGVVNGYDIDYNCNYYLIIRWIDDENKIKYLAIARTKLEDMDFAAKGFRIELLEFISTSFKRYITPIDKKFICPVLFDIYNKNLSLTTLENDDEYRQALKEFYKSTMNFVDHLSYYNYYAFTEFIIRNYFMFEDNLEGIKVYNKDSIISMNQKYKGSVSRLRNLYLNESKRKNYESNNFQELFEIEYLIQ